MADKYYTVRLDVYAFDTKEEAGAYAEKLTEAFCSMPESAECGSYCQVIEETEED